MKIRPSLLKDGFASDWVIIPASPIDPDQDCGLVKIREVKNFDELWAALERAEQTAIEKAKELGPLHAETVQARLQEQEAGYKVIEACVIDHNPHSFEAPIETPEDEQALRQMGYSDIEIENAKKEGVACKSFGGEMARFYEKCAPYRGFYVALLQAIQRYVAYSEVTPPARIWFESGVSRERILASAYAPKEADLALWEEEKKKRAEKVRELRRDLRKVGGDVDPPSED